MMTIRPARERGDGKLDWLKTRYSFSFADYYDPTHMGFKSLRVLNEDWIAPNGGFDTHGHRDMEVVTYLLNGAIAHKDSTGSASTLIPGTVQRMTAGKGIRHSEFNPSSTTELHLLQIWILPEKEGLTPGYEERAFPLSDRQGKWQLIASPNGRENSLTIHQQVDLFASQLESGDALAHTLKPNHSAWLQVARGELLLNGQTVKTGDGVALENEPELNLSSKTESELLLFDFS